MVSLPPKKMNVTRPRTSRKPRDETLKISSSSESSSWVYSRRDLKSLPPFKKRPFPSFCRIGMSWPEPRTGRGRRLRTLSPAWRRRILRKPMFRFLSSSPRGSLPCKHRLLSRRLESIWGFSAWLLRGERLSKMISCVSTTRCTLLLPPPAVFLTWPRKRLRILANAAPSSWTRPTSSSLRSFNRSLKRSLISVTRSIRFVSSVPPSP
mmetsp:Transcript_19237/g.41601  ORF Transcript_19237/g.41601 Transcript_19237/m.41601 type:complete len:208 (-) Transcript_19237:350-973(-)